MRKIINKFRKINRIFLPLILIVALSLGTFKFLLLKPDEAKAGDVYLGLDEGYGTSSSVNDKNGSVSAGSITNAIWKTEDMCKSGKCLYFDGTGDYISFADDDDLDMGSGNSVTIVGWFRTPDITSGTRTIISKEEATNADGGFRIEMDSNGYIRFGIDNENSTFPSDHVTSTTAYDDNKWHHFAAVKDAGTSITLYIDTISVGTPDTSPAADVSNDDSFYIGTYYNGSSTNAYSGFIDEVKIYRSARTAAQIKTDFAGETPNRGVSASFGPDSSWISNGLVGYWKLEDASDSSGNGTTLTNNSTTPFTAGKFGNASEHDGSADYLEAADNATLSLTGNLTLSAWINNDDTTGSQNIIGKWDGTNNSYLLALEGDELRMYIDSVDNHQTTTSTNIGSNTFTHVAGVYNATTQTVKLFVNGVEQASTTTGGTIPASIGDDAGEFVIGASDAPAGYFDGHIDDARVYNRALSPAEIRLLADWAPGPVAYFTLDENTGISTAYDRSGNGLTGTLTNITASNWAPGKYGSALQFISSGGGSGGFPTVEATNTSTVTTDQTSHTVNLPTGIASGDLLIVFFTKDAAGATSFGISWPAGWTEIADECRDDSSSSGPPECQAGTSFVMEYSVAYRVANGSEGSTITVTSVDNDLSAHVSYRISGIDTGTAPEIAINNPQSASTTPDPSSLNPTNWDSENTLWIAGFASDNPTVSHPATADPSNYTNAVEADNTGASSGVWLRTMRRELAAASEDPGTFTMTASEQWIASTVAIRPAAASGGSTSYLDIGTGPTAVNTVSFWVKPETTTEYFVNITGTSDYIWSNAGTLTATGFTTTPTYYVNGVQSQTITAGVWQYVTVVTDTAENASNLDIGRTADANYMIGTIDDIRIYNYARSAGQVVQDMNAGHPAPGSPVGSAIGHWKFDEGADNTCSGGVNDVCNSGSQSTNIDGTSTASRTNSGKFGRALTFDGTDDVVNLGSNNAIDDLPAGGMSISAWIYPTGMGENSRGIIMAKNSGATPSSGWIFQLAGTNALKFSVDGSTDLVRQTSNSVVNLNSWNHVSLYWDGVITTASGVHIFVNATEVTYATTTDGASRVSDAASTLYLGNDSAGSSTFAGSIDEVRLYNSSLTSEQIKLAFNQASMAVMGAKSTDSSGNASWSADREYCPPGNTETNCGSGNPAPVGVWKLDENTGTTTNDTSENSNYLTLTNGPTWTNGKHGTGIEFDGSDDCAIDSATSGLAPQVGNLTVSAWIYRDTTNTDDYIVQLDGNDESEVENTNFKFYVNDTDNTLKLAWEHSTPTAGTNEIATSSTGLTNSSGSWTYVTAVRNVSVNTVTFYENGNILGSAFSYTYDPVGGTDDQRLTIGSSNSDTCTTTTDVFDGKIDEVKVYSYIRTPAQVAWDYNHGKPLAHWKMDETSWNGTAGEVKNSSGNSLHGVRAGDATTTTSGKFNNSGTFDGTGDYVNLGNGDTFQCNANTGFSVAAWYQWDTDPTADNDAIISRHNDSSNRDWMISNDYGGLMFVVATSQTAGQSLYQAGGLLQGVWTHVVGVWDPITDVQSIYINGKLSNSNTLSTCFSASSRSTFIGASAAPTPNRLIDGQIDDVRFYNYPVTPEQVKLIMNEGAAIRFGPN